MHDCKAISLTQCTQNHMILMHAIHNLRLVWRMQAMVITAAVSTPRGGGTGTKLGSPNVVSPSNH